MDKINPGQPAVDGEIEKRLSLITVGIAIEIDKYDPPVEPC